MTRESLVYGVCAVAGAAAVYGFAQWRALTDPYVVADDVRQQIYWMRSWADPALFRGDLLTDYARCYVPWGVKAIYAAALPLADPVRFSAVLSGILFAATAGFVFALGSRLRDPLTGLLAACFFCLLGHFMENITGGLARSFAYPLLAAHLYFLAAGALPAAGAVTLLAPLLNPYAFLLCLVSFVLYAGLRPRQTAARQEPRPPGDLTEGSARSVPDGRANLRVSHAQGPPQGDGGGAARVAAGGILAAGGVLLALVQYVVFAPRAFGPLVTRADMVGRAEYSALGRYEIYPFPSLLAEVARPWVFNLPFTTWGPLPAWSLAAVGLSLIVYACFRGRWASNVGGLRPLWCLLAASVLLFLAARLFVFRLFVPGRYIEFSLNLLWCLGLAACARAALKRHVSDRAAHWLLAAALLATAAPAVRGLGVYDYAQDEDLCRFLASTPKSSLIAGHPEVMDNVPTFARRKTFVTYELSHTWYTKYWAAVRQRTLDLFDAYYADDPEAVRRFCRENGVDYLVVRDSDFSPQRLARGGIYFQPFDDHIRRLTRGRTRYALLDTEAFTPVYEKGGMRVVAPAAPSRGVAPTADRNAAGVAEVPFTEGAASR
jgi:hypothetical protein